MQPKPITGLQLRAARGALSWSVRELSNRSKIGTATIVRFEEVSGVPKTRGNTMLQLIRILEEAGIEFIGSPDDAPGIRIHKQGQSD